MFTNSVYRLTFHVSTNMFTPFFLMRRRKRMNSFLPDGRSSKANLMENLLMLFLDDFSVVLQDSMKSHCNSWGRSSASSGGISSGGLVHLIRVSGDRYRNTSLANRSSSKSSSPLSRTRYMSRQS